MKIVPALLLIVALAIAPGSSPPAVAQTAPSPAEEANASGSSGINDALLNGEFSLDRAPEIPATGRQKAFIDRVVGELKRNYGGTMVLEDSPHRYMDTPEFLAWYLRAFGDPAGDFRGYDYRFERLMTRVVQHMPMLEDPRLDWDLWRGWLLFENTGQTSGRYQEAGTIYNLDGAKELLWNYLTHNAAAILKDEKRRAWWITQLTRDLEARGGRPHRRWFLLALLRAADPRREALEKIPLPEKSAAGDRGDRKIRLRQPHPLDPFLLVEDETAQAPSFTDALTKMAVEQKLALEVLGLDPLAQPATIVHRVDLEMARWPGFGTSVINQESWSRTDPGILLFSGSEWGVNFSRAVGRRGGFSSVSFPPDRTDGVFFFVFNQRLYVWPKAQMDPAVIQMLQTAGLINEAARGEYVKRGFAPLPSTVLRELP
jgi:hypothetical protein